MRHHDGPFELPLPEDNATAIQIICSVIHFQNDKILQTLPASDVLAVAIAADMYDCTKALQFASKPWLRELKVKSEDLMLLAAAAYLVRNAQSFREITAALVLNHHGSYLALSGEDTASIMPWEVLYLLEEQRGFAKLQLAELLISGVSLANCDYKCGWTGRYAYEYIWKLDFDLLWPAHLSKQSITTALQKTETMSDPLPWEQSVPCTDARHHHVPQYRIWRNGDIEHLREKIGLCLECDQGGSNRFECKQPSHSSQS